MANSNAPVKIITCTCDHAFQDATYGPKKRAGNPKAADKPESQRYTYSACSREVGK